MDVATPDQRPSADAGFAPAAPNELAARLRVFAERQGLTVSPQGLPASIDTGLAQDATFDTSELDGRTKALLPRWAEIYLQDVDRDIPVLTSLRDRHAEIAARAANDLIAQYEFDQNEQVHNDEIAAGWYTIQKDTAALDAQSQQVWATATKAASDAVTAALQTTTIDWTTQDPEKFAAYKAHAAVASLFSVYNDQHKAHAPDWDPKLFTWMTSDLVEGPFDKAPHVLPTPATPTVGVHSVPDALWGIVKASALPETIFSFASVNSQAILSQGAAQSTALTAASKAKLAAWSAADEGFRRTRTQTAVDVNAMRHLARQSPRASLNYGEQLGTMRREFLERLSDVYVRCRVVAGALPAIWGQAVPALPDVAAWDDQQGSFFSAILLWIASVKRVVAVSAGKELNTVLPLSVAAAVGPANWAAIVAKAAASNAPSLEFQFAIGPSNVPNMSFVRLKGVMAFTVGIDDAAAGPWQAVLTPPAQGAASSARPKVTQDQPKIDLSRMQSRENPKPPDVVGLSSLRNILALSDGSAPDGLWLLQVRRLSLRGSDATKLRDIEIDFLVAGGGL